MRFSTTGRCSIGAASQSNAALAEATDPNKLNDLKAALDGDEVYSPEQVQGVVGLFLGGAERDKLDLILDACVAVYVSMLNEGQQVEFKGKAKMFCRTYEFLASVMPCTNREWEKLSILLNMLTPELDRLSNILKTLNKSFCTLFTDADRVMKRIREDIVPKVAADEACKNAKENTPHTARMAHDQALGKVMQLLLKDDTKVYKQFVEDESFRRSLGALVYALTSG